ncbi:MAG TPA: FAD-linked oxidase C-terminal domain-containing protein, partial [Mycobacteriales bacterium]|nr:FAD-linked oxidase C-terminal domain-containing protein [Mycobacteriales bacterium]
MTGVAELTSACLARFDKSQVITEPAELRTYECDGLSSYRSTPGLVVLAESAEDVGYVVAQCAALGVPFVARGSGTGLSGGALPRTDGVLIVTSRLNRIITLDPADERAVVEPGVINANLTAAASPHGYYYAPDPSSQQVCSIGGNVAENSGGAHCLKYGFTAHHVTGLEVVMPDGSTERFGGLAPDPVGYDVVGAMVGSEGTLGVVTEATVRLLRTPQAVQTLLAAFATIEAAGDAVSAIIAAGVLPAAIELMDALAIEAAEAAVHPGYPAGAGAVLIVELDGPRCEVEAQLADVESLCLSAHAFDVRVAADAAERALIWKGRKSAFAAVGRISPDYIVQDGVIPRTALAGVLQAIDEVAGEAGLRVANVFHAGDGNLHPLILYDENKPGELEKTEQFGADILKLCVEVGGVLTGEHGVGIEKRDLMGEQFTEIDLDQQMRVKCAFDPDHLLNPGKVFPKLRRCAELGRVVVHHNKI